jgi:hypothetical protein
VYPSWAEAASFVVGFSGALEKERKRKEERKEENTLFTCIQRFNVFSHKICYP